MAISIGSAVGAGFNLIGRRPLSVIVWGFFLYFSILLLFAAGVLIVGFQVFGRFATLSATSDPAQVRQAILAVLMALWPAALLVVFGGLIVGAMVQGAVYRSILFPEQKGGFSLRLGARELSLILLAFVLLFFAILACLASGVVIGGVVYLGSRIGRWGVLVDVLFGIAYALAFMWLVLRFSMAAPMTFAEGRVRFFGSWALTRGHGWALFGLAWVLVLVFIGVSIGIGIVNGIIGAIFTGGMMTAVVASAGNDPNALAAHWPAMLLAYIPTLLLGAVAQGIMQAITHGPWAEVYRELKGSPDVSTTFS